MPNPADPYQAYIKSLAVGTMLSSPIEGYRPYECSVAGRVSRYSISYKTGVFLVPSRFPCILLPKGILLCVRPHAQVAALQEIVWPQMKIGLEGT